MNESTTVKIFKLERPIPFDGAEINEIHYDFEGMTARDKKAASKEYVKDEGALNVQELDSEYHLYLFAAAAKKVNRNIEMTDILRMSARDAIRAQTIARDFFFLSSAE